MNSQNIPNDKNKSINVNKNILNLSIASNESIRKAISRLLKNKHAIDYLHNQGLIDQTIEHFGLGLSSPYIDKNDITHSDALFFPNRNEQGRLITPNAYLDIPGITQNSQHKASCGINTCNFNTAKTTDHTMLLVCQSYLDQFIIHQNIRNTELEKHLLVIASNNLHEVPDQIKNSLLFFNSFEKVFISTFSNIKNKSYIQCWSELAGPKSFIIEPTYKDKIFSSWAFYFNELKNIDIFSNLLSNADYASNKSLSITPKSVKDYKPNKLYNLAPTDISCTFHNNYFYYPIKVHQTKLDEETNSIFHDAITIVIRSDKKLLRYHALPSTHNNNCPIYTLNDGTVIDGPPRTPAYSSWSFDSINAWINGDFKPRKIDFILKDIKKSLQSRVWLPNIEDFDVLSLIVVITYIQDAFEAVPLILMEGAPGSGKTEMTEAMTRLSANGVIISESSGATISRTIEETRGFIAIDDLEKIARNKSKTSSSADDIIQILKTSYKKSSAKRNVTDTKTMTVKTLNYFGVKMMSNTSGIDEILGTRTLKFYTRLAPRGKFKSEEIDIDFTTELRHELHAWAMENIKTVHKYYLTIDRDVRIDEICAPLRSIADQTQKSYSKKLNQSIDTMIKKRESNDIADKSPSDISIEALIRLINLGYKTISLDQVIMEMSLLVSIDYEKENTSDIPMWRKIKWQRRNLLDQELISTPGEKFRPHGVALTLIYQITKKAIEIAKVEKKNDGLSSENVSDTDGKRFCKMNLSCSECRYNGVVCDIRLKTKKS